MDSKVDTDRLSSPPRHGGGGRRICSTLSWSHHHAYHRHHSKLRRSRISLLATLHARGNALPFFAGVTTGLATYHSGSGPIGAIIVGLITSSITFAAGQIAFTTVRSPLIRAAI